MILGSPWYWQFLNSSNSHRSFPFRHRNFVKTALLHRMRWINHQHHLNPPRGHLINRHLRGQGSLVPRAGPTICPNKGRDHGCFPMACQTLSQFVHSTKLHPCHNQLLQVQLYVPLSSLPEENHSQAIPETSRSHPPNLSRLTCHLLHT